MRRAAVWLVTTAVAVGTSLACNAAAAPPTSSTVPSPTLAGSTPLPASSPPIIRQTVPPVPAITPPPEPADTLPRGNLVFGSTKQVPFEGDPQSSFYLFPDTLVWSAGPWQNSQSPLIAGAGRIQELSFASGQVRTLYTAPTVNGAVEVKASAEWLGWLELTDRFGLSDARLYAMPRRGGTPVLIDDVRRYASRTSFPTWCIDGTDLYWTFPEIRDGRPIGDLRHKRLPDGPTEVLVAALPGQIIGWPSAYQGVLAYEVRSDSEDPHVVVRVPDGTTRDVGRTPASEPAVGDGFVAFKRARVTETSSLAAFILADGRIVGLGIGESPRASGSWLAWGSWVKDPLDPASTSPVFVSKPELGCIARFKRSIPTNGSLSIPAIAGGRAVWMMTDLDKGQADRQTIVIDELLDLRC